MNMKNLFIYFEIFEPKNANKYKRCCAKAPPDSIHTPKIDFAK